MEKQLKRTLKMVFLLVSLGVSISPAQTFDAITVDKITRTQRMDKVLLNNARNEYVGVKLTLSNSIPVTGISTNPSLGSSSLSNLMTELAIKTAIADGTNSSATNFNLWLGTNIYIATANSFTTNHTTNLFLDLLAVSNLAQTTVGISNNTTWVSNQWVAVSNSILTNLHVISGDSTTFVMTNRIGYLQVSTNGGGSSASGDWASNNWVNGGSFIPVSAYSLRSPNNIFYVIPDSGEVSLGRDGAVFQLQSGGLFYTNAGKVAYFAAVEATNLELNAFGPNGTQAVQAAQSATGGGITNIVSTGPGTSIVFGVAGTVSTNKSLTGVKGIQISDYSNEIRIGYDGSQPSAELKFNGVTTPDYAFYYLGYPKLTLDISMLSSSSDAGTKIVLNSFTNAFDDNFISVTTTGAINNQSHAYMVDLVTNYTGFVHLVVVGKQSAIALKMSLGYGLSDIILSSGVGVGGFYTDASKTPEYFSTVAQTKTNTIIKPFSGSKIVFSINALTAAQTYWIKDFSIYGVTNGFNSFTGSL